MEGRLQTWSKQIVPGEETSWALHANGWRDRFSGAVCYDDEIMMEFKQEETSEAVATKTLVSNEEISKEDVETRRFIEERRTTPKEEKQRHERSEQTNGKMHQGQEKSEKDRKRKNESSKTSKV